MKKAIIILIIQLIVGFFGNMPKLQAHGGEDHGVGNKANATPHYFSSENSSEKYEVLVKYQFLKPGEIGHLKLYLSNARTNEPIAHAKLKISSPDLQGQDLQVKFREPGVYEFQAHFKEKKEYHLNVSIDAALGADLIQIGGIETGKELPAAMNGQNGNSLNSNFLMIIYILGALILGLVIGLFFKKGSKKYKSLTSLFLLMVFTFNPASNLLLLAHGGEEHGKQEESHVNGSFQFLVDKETQFLFDIRTDKIGKSSFSPSLKLFGTILPTSSGRAVIQAPQAGIVRSLSVSVGQQVKKGQLLASIEQNVDAGTKIDWITQKNTLEAEMIFARKEYDRLKKISDIAAKSDLDEAERMYNAARSNFEAFNKLGASGSGDSKMVFLYSPISGKVDNFILNLGSTVNVGQEILSITDIKKVYVEAQVFNKDVNQVRLSKEFLIEGKNGNGSIYGRLVTISSVIDMSNQTQRVVIELDNEDEGFKIGEFVDVLAFQASSSQKLVIPNTAITEINGKTALFVKNSSELYSLRYVSVEEDNGQFTVVGDGLEAGEKIVLSGVYQLKIMYMNQ